MLKSGTKAPEFVLPNDHGGQTSLAGLLKNGSLILYFYPADFTPGCTREACSIRDIHDDIKSVGLQVAGISPQDTESHQRFRDEYELPFTLLSDSDKSVIRQYDVDGPFGVGVRRATYLINRNSIIEDGVLADVRIGLHKEFIQTAVELSEAAARK